jgi:hypothetical protein
MDAIRKVRRYIKQHPQAPEALTLKGLAACLMDERQFPLADLYELDLEAFELAMELMRDWRLDRYYAARLELLEPLVGDSPTATPAGRVATAWAA